MNKALHAGTEVGLRIYLLHKCGTHHRRPDQEFTVVAICINALTLISLLCISMFDAILVGCEPAWADSLNRPVGERYVEVIFIDFPIAIPTYR